MIQTRHGTIEIYYGGIIDGERFTTYVFFYPDATPKDVKDYDGGQGGKLPNGLYTGNATKSAKDNFCRKIGRKVALARALAKSQLTKNERTDVWEDFAKECHLV